MIEFRPGIWIGGGCDDPIELQPLSRKAVAKPLQSFVLEHSLDLGIKCLGITQFSIDRFFQKNRVGYAAPEKVGKSRCEGDVLVIVCLALGDWLIPQVEKPWGGQSG